MWGGGWVCTDPMSDLGCLGQVGRGGDQAGRCAIPTPRTNALVPSGLPSGAATMASPRISTCPSCQGLELRTCSEWTRLQNLNQGRAYQYIERLARRITHAGGVCIGKCTFGTESECVLATSCLRTGLILYTPSLFGPSWRWTSCREALLSACFSSS